ncbi:MAG: hypothetical protein Q4F53_06785 [Nesterenkonia sp.]|nr:hypothetical protein [Nesterenkonia sp.]
MRKPDGDPSISTSLRPEMVIAQGLACHMSMIDIPLTAPDSTPPDSTLTHASRIPEGRRRRRLLRDGLSESRLRRDAETGTTLRLAHGLYLPLPRATSAEEVDEILRLRPPSPEWATLQALTAEGPHVVSHGTAAIIHGLWDAAPTAPFHITSPRPGGQMRRPGVVVGHRSAIPEEQTMEVQGVRVTTPARTWADCATQMRLVEALVMADRAIRHPWPEWEGRTQPLATPAELDLALRRKGRARGVRTARAALVLSRIGSDSPPETRLRYAFHRAGLPEPEVNVPVVDESGRILFRPDLGFRRYKVSVQYDGEPHSDPRRVRRDVRRGESTDGAGWLQVLITADHMHPSPEAAVEKTKRALRSRGWDG